MKNNHLYLIPKQVRNKKTSKHLKVLISGLDYNLEKENIYTKKWEFRLTILALYDLYKSERSLTFRPFCSTQFPFDILLTPLPVWSSFP